MSLRQLSEVERHRLELLTAAGIEYALLRPTATGLQKSIMDATAAVRNYLKTRGVHDFELQGRGAAKHGVKISAVFFNADAAIDTTASLYKPEAKPDRAGDPRICLYGLKKFAKPDDMLAIIENGGLLAVINITKTDLVRVLEETKRGPLWDFLADARKKANEVAMELLERLRRIAALGLVASVMDERADTAIGRTLEAALGIAMNSRRTPDYKGIEIKSHRLLKRRSKNSFFAQVPNWSISNFKSMTQILDAFGYPRGSEFKLNCTVSAATVNSQGLSLAIDQDTGILDEISADPRYGRFASWFLAELRQRLVEKHTETFWVHAKSHFQEGKEHFEFKSVVHTRQPIISQFDTLIEQGEITVDHMVSRQPSGKARERGPAFKIKPRSLTLLFPRNETYSLTVP